MDRIRLFIRVEATAVLSLLLAATLMAALGAAPFGNPGTAFAGPADAATFYFTSTLLIGAVPAIALGGPLYFLLLRQGEPRWFYVVLIGVMPGLAFLPFDHLLGTMAVLCGLLVASLTHLACRRIRHAA